MEGRNHNILSSKHVYTISYTHARSFIFVPSDPDPRYVNILGCFWFLLSVVLMYVWVCRGVCVFSLIIFILSQHLPAPPGSSVLLGRMLPCPARMTLRLKEAQVSAGDTGRCPCLNAPTQSSHPRTGGLFSGGPPGTSCWDGSQQASFP